MKHLSKSLLTLVFICSTVFFISAQKIENGFISGQGRFSIRIAEAPDSIKDASSDIGIGKTYRWETPKGIYQVQFLNLFTDDEEFSRKERDKLLTSFRNSFIKILNEQSAVFKEDAFSKNGLSGYEFQLIKSQDKTIFRIFILDKKYYWVSATIDESEENAKAYEILDSLKYLDEKTQTEQLIKEATPQPLPQKPVAEKLKSDAEDENLKGKVKSLLEESQETGKSPRIRTSEIYFNENGNRVKETVYFNGYAYHIKAWGYLDGFRVFDENSVEYDDLYKKTGIIKGVIVGESGSSEPEPAWDPRYSYKFTYKYDENGLLNEEKMYQSNGKLWLRYVYIYKEDQRENLTYSEDGKLNYKTVEILDENRNVIEERWFDDDGKVGDVTTYTYKFDKNGNWIEKRSFEKSQVNGKTVLKPSEIRYRTITYYP